MMYSLAGVIQLANDELDANEQINDVHRSIYAHTYNPDLYQVSAIFETDDLDNFLTELNKKINQFLQEYQKQ